LASNPGEFAQQYFSEASLRILLDDYATPGNVASGCAGSDMMSLDGIDTATNPLDLTTLDGAKPGWWNANTTQSGSKFVPLPTAALVTPASTAYTVYNTSSAGTGDGYWVTNGSPTITGCIKIEYQDNNNVFHDITKKILGAGFTGRNINPSSSYSFSTPLKTPYLPTATQVGAQGPTFGNINVTSTIPCSDPSTGAIIRLERVRDNPSTATAGNSYCGTGLNDTNGYNYWPLVLYDSREGLFRGSAGAIPPNSPTQSPEGNPELTMKGVMYYVELDAANLATWLSANQAGLNLMNNSGFGVYFSDRRGEQTDPNAGNTRTGSFGFNDVVNPSDTTYGCPNGALDSGEDFEGDGILRTYGAAPTTIPYLLTGVVPAGVGNLPTTATMAVLQNAYCTATYTRLWPGADLVHVQEARENMPFFFRRALKIVNGQSMNAGTSCYGAGANPPCGVTVASEKPVYIQGDFNAVYSETTSPWSLPAGVASSVAADAITLLSDNWNDVNTFINPYDDSYRKGVTTAYRVAIIAGKELPFPWPSGQAADLGTDGGVHNLMRFLENWNSSCYYMGSLVTFSFNRQALGLFQSSGALYAPPSRQFSFDTNFTNGPQWLPPDTPVLRSINTTGFSQMMMPTQ
jgi:hypothetical protein